MKMRTTEEASLEFIHRANACTFFSQNCAEYMDTETSQGLISPKDKLATPILYFSSSWKSFPLYKEQKLWIPWALLCVTSNVARIRQLPRQKALVKSRRIFREMVCGRGGWEDESEGRQSRALQLYMSQ